MVRATTKKHVKNTNIYVEASAALTNSATVNSYVAIRRDIPNSNSLIESLRPDKKLMDPAESFAQSTKTLRPALRFNTYDRDVVKNRRKAKREQHVKATEERRARRVVPNPALKSGLNPKKLPPSSLDNKEDAALFDEARTERDDTARKLGLRVKKLGKARNRKDFRDPLERRTVVGDDL